MWEVGTQSRAPRRYRTTEELKKIEGHIDEKDAKIALYELLRGNPTFAADLLMNVKLYPFQHIAIKTMFETDYTMGVWCLDENEYVLSSTGYKKMKDIKVGDYVRSREKLNRVSAQKNNPEEDGLEIITNTGEKFRAKIGHKVLAYDDKNIKFEFTNIEELQVGGYIPIKLGTKVFGDTDYSKTTKKMSLKNEPDLFYLLGYMIGDGWVDQGRFYICSENTVIINLFERKCAEYFPGHKVYKRGRGENKNFYELCISNCDFRDWLLEIGFDFSLKAPQKEIPDKLLSLGEKNICALISGIFDSDGYCSVLKEKRYKNSKCLKLGFKSTSYKLLSQVKMLISNIGISGSINRSGVTPQGNEYYDLIIKRDSYELFRNKIGFKIEYKQKNLEEALTCDYRSYSQRLIPNLGTSLKRAGYNKQVCKGHSVSKDWGSSVSHYVLDEFSDDLPIKEKIDKIKKENTYISEIVEINNVRTKSIDITVESEENYIANSMVHHNSRGASKCTSYDSLVWTDRGLIKMGDIEVGDCVQSLKGPNKVLAKTINPIEKTYKIETKTGLISEGLDYHKVLTLSENLDFAWKHNKDIKTGDFLIIKKDFDMFSYKDIFEDYSYTSDTINPNKPKELLLREEHVNDWFYFFGLLLGDGCMLPRRAGISITSCDFEIIDFMKRFSEEIGLSLSVYNKESKAQDLRIHSVQLYNFLEWLGFDKLKAFEKVIPTKLTNNSQENICLLIKGLFDTDGYASSKYHTKKRHTKVTVGFTSTSELLLSQVQNLLLQLNIKPNKIVCFKGGDANFGDKVYSCRKAWALTIYNKKDLKLFHEKIGFLIARKSEGLASSFNQKYDPGTFSDTVPFVGDFLSKFHGFKSVNVGSKKLAFRKNTSKSSIKGLLETGKFENFKQKLLELTREDICFEEVREVSTGKCVTVDITVENEHCYVSDGIINHNSWSTAVYAILDAILNQGVSIGIISRSFRQAKLIFNKIEEIANKPGSELFNQCITRTSKGSDQWRMEIGRSTILALPLGDGEKLRGFRFHRIIIDEFLLMPESIFNEVIMPFLAVVDNPVERTELIEIENELIKDGIITEDDRYRWPNNKVILLSSASYKFEYMYELYCKFEKLITMSARDKDKLEKPDLASRAILHFSYDMVPEGLYDANLLNQSKATMSESQFEREFGAVFTDDSKGYFEMSKMQSCVIPPGESPSIELQGDSSCEYILSFDPSWSLSDGSDDFAIHILKLNKGKQAAVVVHVYAIPGTPLTSHMQYFQYCLENFNIVAIVGDYMGGVKFIESFNETDYCKKKGELKTIEVPFDKPEEYVADISSLRNQYNLTNKRIVILRKPTSQWIRQSNELLQASFEKKRLFFGGAAMNQTYDEQKNKSIPMDRIVFIRKEDDFNQSAASRQIDFIDHQAELMDLTKIQCALIFPKTSPMGVQSFDLPDNLKKQAGKNKTRKDCYSSLILGNWMTKLYFDMQKAPGETMQTTFTPFMT